MKLISLPTKESLISSAEWHEAQAVAKHKKYPDEAQRHRRIAAELRKKANGR